MTDHAESELRKWARKRNGAELGIKDVVDLVFAMADDHDEDHAETLELLRSHQDEADERDRRIDVVEQWCREWEGGCALREKAILDQHLIVHADHMAADHLSRPPHRAGDEVGSSFYDEREMVDPEMTFRTRFMWTLGSKAGQIAVAVCIVLLTLLINWLVTGKP